MTPLLALPCLNLDAETVRVVVVRRERPRAVLADGSPVPITDPRCIEDDDGQSEATVFREYVAIRADNFEPIALSFSGIHEKTARMLNVLLEMPFKGGPIPYFARVFAVNSRSVVPGGFCSEELYQLAEATSEAVAGRRLVATGAVSQ